MVFHLGRYKAALLACFTIFLKRKTKQAFTKKFAEVLNLAYLNRLKHLNVFFCFFLLLLLLLLFCVYYGILMIYTHTLEMF